MKDLRRQIYALVEERSSGVIMDPNEPLDTYAHRIFEALSGAEGEITEAVSKRKEAEEEAEDLKSELEDLKAEKAG